MRDLFRHAPHEESGETKNGPNGSVLRSPLILRSADRRTWHLASPQVAGLHRAVLPSTLSIRARMNLLQGTVASPPGSWEEARLSPCRCAGVAALKGGIRG